MNIIRISRKKHKLIVFSITKGLGTQTDIILHIVVIM